MLKADVELRGQVLPELEAEPADGVVGTHRAGVVQLLALAGAVVEADLGGGEQLVETGAGLQHRAASAQIQRLQEDLTGREVVLGAGGDLAQDPTLAGTLRDLWRRRSAVSACEQ